MRFRWLFAVLTFMLAAVASACGGGDGTTTAEASASDTPASTTSSAPPSTTTTIVLTTTTEAPPRPGCHFSTGSLEGVVGHPVLEISTHLYPCMFESAERAPENGTDTIGYSLRGGMSGETYEEARDRREQLKGYEMQGATVTVVHPIDIGSGDAWMTFIDVRPDSPGESTATLHFFDAGQYVSVSLGVAGGMPDTNEDVQRLLEKLATVWMAAS